jgi:hypothetical protein
VQLVITDSPAIHHPPLVVQNKELQLAEALPTELPVEALDIAVCRRRAGNDVMLGDLVIARLNGPILRK